MCGPSNDSAPAAPLAAEPKPVTFEPLLLNPATRDGYNVATALRGPDFADDSHADTLKEMTTSVLRYFVGAVKWKPGAVTQNAMGIVHTPEEALKIWESRGSTSQSETLALYNNKWHFTDHFSAALGSLETLFANEPEKQQIVKQYRADLRARGFRYL